MKRISNKAKVIIGAAMVLACVAVALAFGSQQGDGDDGFPEPDTQPVVAETSVQAVDPEEWIGLLSEEQQAAVDIAYEASVAEGYEGTREEWLSTEVTVGRNHAGDLVVGLPDGDELVVLGEGAHEEEGESSGSEKGGSSGADAGEGAAGSGSAGAGEQVADEPSPDDESHEAESEERDGTRIVVESTTARPGATDVEVRVAIHRNPGILGLALSVSYDEDALVLKGAEVGDAFRGILAMTRSKGYGSGCIFTWDGVEVKESDVRDGTILTLYFDVLADAQLGDYPITVSCEGSVVNNDLRTVDVTVRDGSVVVK